MNKKTGANTLKISRQRSISHTATADVVNSVALCAI
ncbi:hypothetical protein GGR42_000081 [Saonia flava]|uniref:Uncharacterized protein n=1 Tax=Saonia flava TaxID=523696 RepID=A0A846QYC5_9FLAO|nr:hypothetical protein [Saonia flava]